MDKNKNILMENNEKIDIAINSIMLELIKFNKFSHNDFEIKRTNAPRVANLELRDFLKNKLLTLCVECEVGNKKAPYLRKNSNKSGNFVTVLDEILESFYADSDTKVKDIAECLAMSERQLYRKVKQSLNFTPSEYLKLYRLKKATNLLSRGRGVNCVAHEVGFNSHAYFSRCFKRHFGKLPSEYKRSRNSLKQL